jgi:hypothetical protein
VTIVFIVVVSLLAIGALLTVASVGKPRGPITGGMAVTTVITQILLIAAITWFYHA